MAQTYVLDLAAEGRRAAADSHGMRLEALLASLPPMLFGLALSAFLLGFVPPSQVVFGGPTPFRVVEPSFAPYILPATVGTVLVLGSVVGACRRLPRWSYTWATGAVVAVLFSLTILGDELPFLISPTVDVLTILALLALLSIVVLIAAWRGPVDAGLVGLGFAGCFAVAVTFGATAGPFSRVDMGLLSMPVGLLCAVFIIAYLRGSVLAKQAAVSFVGALCAALIWVYRSIIFTLMPHFGDQSFHWKLLAFAGGGLLGPPLTCWLLRARRAPRLG